MKRACSLNTNKDENLTCEFPAARPYKTLEKQALIPLKTGNELINIYG